MISDAARILLSKEFNLQENTTESVLISPPALVRKARLPVLSRYLAAGTFSSI
jgi:hypothetical protein